MLKHVEDVEDRSNTPKGCNAMYVEDVEDAYSVRITMKILIQSIRIT